MAPQVFETGQAAVDYANGAEFTALCFTEWGYSLADAAALVERLRSDTASLEDQVLILKLGEARASFVRMAKP